MAIDQAVLAGISIERLRSFCAIAEAGSIVAAADRNPVKQSLFSRQIRDLERALGTALFRREGKRLRLTADGVKLAALTNAYFSALRELGNGPGGAGNPIRIAAAESVVRWVLTPSFLEVLAAAGAPVSVNTFNTAETVEKLESGQIDAAIIREDAATETLEVLPFGRLQYALIVPRKHLPDRSPSGIQQSDIIPFVSLTGGGRFVRVGERVAAQNHVNLHVVASVESFALAIEVAQVIEAAVFVPAQAEAEFPGERFTRVPLEGGAALDRPLVVVYAKSIADINPRARRFAMRLARAFEQPHAEARQGR